MVTVLVCEPTVIFRKQVPTGNPDVSLLTKLPPTSLNAIPVSVPERSSNLTETLDILVAFEKRILISLLYLSNWNSLNP